MKLYHRFHCIVEKKRINIFHWERMSRETLLGLSGRKETLALRQAPLATASLKWIPENQVTSLRQENYQTVELDM